MFSRIPTAAREAVKRRSAGRCEVCGAGPVSQVHHRCPRQKGGSLRPIHALANLLGTCNVCHERIESNRQMALDYGWLILRGEWEQAGCDASGFLVMYRGREAHLGNDGKVYEIEELNADEHQ